jgi:hypothetical protein
VLVWQHVIPEILEEIQGRSYRQVQAICLSLPHRKAARKWVIFPIGAAVNILPLKCSVILQSTRRLSRPRRAIRSTYLSSEMWTHPATPDFVRTRHQSLSIPNWTITVP